MPLICSCSANTGLALSAACLLELEDPCSPTQARANSSFALALALLYPAYNIEPGHDDTSHVQANHQFAHNMSGTGPESIPTSADPRSHRATKKRALTPVSAQAATVEALFAKPDQEIRIPSTSDALSKRLRAAPPEIVANVQGSSAGAGSGEFHVYKASRRREYERLREMDGDLKREKEQEEFERDRSAREKKDEEKTRKNREKREKMKARKAKRSKGGGGGGSNGQAGISDNGEVAADGGDDSAWDDSTKQDNVQATSSDDRDQQVPMGSAQQAGLVIHDDDE